MHQGGIDTHALAEATKDASGAASDQADAAQQFSDTAEDINGRMSDAVDQLQAAAKNTKTTIKNAEKSFRQEQRAWVGVQDAVPGDFSDTQALGVTIVFFNSGRTPARNVQTSVRYELSLTPIAGPPPSEVSKLTFHPGSSIAPQGKYNQRIGGGGMVGEPYVPSQISGVADLISKFHEIKGKKLILYYFGILKYDDISGNHRETQYCVFLADPETKQLGFCDAFNDLN